MPKANKDDIIKTNEKIKTESKKISDSIEVDPKTIKKAADDMKDSLTTVGKSRKWVAPVVALSIMGVAAGVAVGIYFGVVAGEGDGELEDYQETIEDMKESGIDITDTSGTMNGTGLVDESLLNSDGTIKNMKTAKSDLEAAIRKNQAELSELNNNSIGAQIDKAFDSVAEAVGLEGKGTTIKYVTYGIFGLLILIILGSILFSAFSSSKSKNDDYDDDYGYDEYY